MTIIFTLTFIAAFLITIVALTIPLSSRARVRSSLENLSAYEAKSASTVGVDAVPFSTRIIRPALDRLGAAARRFTNSGQIERLRLNLALAGVRNLTAEQFYTINLGFTVVGFLIYLILIIPLLIFAGKSLWLGLPIPVLGFLLPEVWLSRRVEARQKRIGATLADSIDILTIAIEAGLTFDSALTKVVKNMEGPLSEEFGRVLGELQIGVARKEALRSLGDRTTVPELQSFCATIIQADTLGVSIGKILKTEAVEIRTRRRQAAEEQALKMPVKMVFPIIFCILPALMLVILGPAIIRIAGMLLQLG
ncbi:MAG: type II secretion system F family protein [Actinomycetota bacterium]|nr:type II secretion system F family protein [Actinomycetota bacterium]